MRILYIALLIILVSFSFYLGTITGDFYPPELFLTLDSGEPAADKEGPELDDHEKAAAQAEEEKEPDLRTVKLITTGNIMATETQISQAKIGEDKYDFRPSFELIAPYLKNADLVVGDLEVAQAGPDISYANHSGYTGWPYFNSPQELSEALYDAGIDIFTLANNHALDRGYEGLMVTIDHIRGLGAETFGAYKSSEERDKPLIIEKDGINIAFIGYTYSTNYIPVPEGHEYCVNHAPYFEDIEPVLEDIRTALEHGADLVAVFPHWGAEHSHEPQPQSLRRAAEEMAAAGADLIIGGHPKWIQPIEWFFNETADGSQRATLAVYSQGSFLTHQYEGDGHNSIYNEFSLLLDIDLTKNYDTGEAWISGVDYEISWTHRGWQHRVLLLSDIFSASPEDYKLSESRVDRFKDIYETSTEVIERYGHPSDMEKALAISERYFDRANEN